MDARSWKSNEVTRWLHSLGLEEHVPAFEMHAITSGEVLLELKEEHLKDMGVRKIGHRLLLLKKLAELTKQKTGVDTLEMAPSAGDIDVSNLFDRLV